MDSNQNTHHIFTHGIPEPKSTTGFVIKGKNAEIKSHTFPFIKNGVFDGEITSISDDATVDDEQGLIYGMHLLMKQNTINVKCKKVKLMLGMAVTAEVKTGTRKIIEFFLAQLLQHGGMRV